ncbi:MAG: hypothetical protein KGI64_11545, partial [Xanthomonadaceae bacterium]|nr:hypothetical protein [Xanthomonadaceae bacterium]
LVGHPPEPEGECGGAYLILDGRNSFARWLVTNNLAHVSNRGGVHISAKTHGQSAERALAYMQAFRGVLAANGIEIPELHSYLD